MTYLLDTNICIGWLRQNQPQIVARIQAQSPGDIVLCSVVVAELLFGDHRALKRLLGDVHRSINPNARCDRADENVNVLRSASARW